MYLLNVQTGELHRFDDSDVLPYAILSHRWEDEEITFDDVQNGYSRSKKGYRKFIFSCRQAAADDMTIFRGRIVEKALSYVWIDTCCINKANSSELSEAINSMYKWYQQAAVCYAYLSDVKGKNLRQFEASQWFTRGWTLQELLAPREVIFYDCDWNVIGKRSELSAAISWITNIPETALRSTKFTPKDYSVADRMSWAAKRRTTRVEDRAYSLLGLFEVNMAMIYGEGMRAFYRLQEEIIKTSPDLTIFAWDKHPYKDLGALAATPDSFEHGSRCFRSVNLNSSMFARVQQRVDWRHDDQGASLSNVGLSASFSLIPWSRMVYLVPVCDIYETFEDYIKCRDPQVTVGMMLDRLESGHFQRASDFEQALFELPEEVRHMEVRRITVCRRELQYFKENGEVEYRGVPSGPNSNGFEFNVIDPLCPGLLQPRTMEENGNLQAKIRNDPSSSLSHVRIFSRDNVAETSTISIPHGTVGVVGFVCFSYPGASPVVLHIGYNLDWNPFCLLTRISDNTVPTLPAELSGEWTPMFVGPSDNRVYRLDRVDHVDRLVRMLRAMSPQPNFQQHDIELFDAASAGDHLRVELPNDVRVSFYDTGSTSPLQVVIEPRPRDGSKVQRTDEDRTGADEEYIKNRVPWPPTLS